MNKLLLLVVSLPFINASMRKITAGLSCKKPFTTCVHVKSVAIPTPAAGHALIQITSSSVNPSDVE